MVAEGDILELFPERPIPTFTLTDLEATEAIRTAIPVLTEEHDGRELATHVLIQTDAVAVVAAYEDDRWRVTHRVDGTDREPSAVFEEAMLRAQGDSSFVDSED